MGDTALMLASGAGQDEVVHELLKAGADVNAKNKGGKTALEMAREGGHSKVETLLEASTDKKVEGERDSNRASTSGSANSTADSDNARKRSDKRKSSQDVVLPRTFKNPKIDAQRSPYTVSGDGADTGSDGTIFR